MPNYTGRCYEQGCENAPYHPKSHKHPLHYCLDHLLARKRANNARRRTKGQERNDQIAETDPGYQVTPQAVTVTSGGTGFGR